jgi:predicted  nucleic acid-binding Zn-ribbon protein
MFRFLKGLVKAGEPPAILQIPDLPAWIEEEEKGARDGLEALVAGRRPVILRARDRAEEILSGFDPDIMEKVSHPKLAGVTERSLPLFLKAMRTSLSRDLPDDPEGFYTASGEILKGCLSAFRGQGRYLASRFPDEMKVLRDGVDTIGREVNALTPEVARARERLRGLADLRESLGGYAEAKRRAAAMRDEIRSLEDGVVTARKSLDFTAQALSELEKGREFRECEKELVRIQRLEEEARAAERTYRETAAPAIHLLKKGEKIAARKRDRDAARILHEAAVLMDRDLPLPEDPAASVIPSGQKALAAMVASGDLVLKNREEIDLMERPDHLLEALAGLSRRFREISAETGSAREALRTRPVLTKRLELKKEVEDLERQVTLAEGRLQHLREEVPDLEERMSASLEEVRGKAGALSGRPVGAGEPDTV